MRVEHLVNSGDSAMVRPVATTDYLLFTHDRAMHSADYLLFTHARDMHSPVLARHRRRPKLQVNTHGTSPPDEISVHVCWVLATGTQRSPS